MPTRYEEIATALRQVRREEEALQVAIKQVSAGFGGSARQVYYCEGDALVPAQTVPADEKGLCKAFPDTLRTRSFERNDDALPSRAWRTDEVVWVDDLRRNPQGLHDHEGHDLGYRGALAMPVSSGNQVLAVIVWLVTSGVPPDAHGLHILSFMRTLLGSTLGRLRAEEQVHTTQEHLRALTSLAVEAIITTNRQGEIIGWNRGAVNLFGYAEEEIHGQPWTRLVPAAYLEAHRVELEEVRRTGAMWQVDRPFKLMGRHKDGMAFPLELSLVSWQVQGEPVFAGIIRDTTERTQAEQVLRASEERFMLAVQGANSGIWDWLDVNQEEQWWSDRFYALLGFEEGEIEASFSQLRQRLHPEDLERSLQQLKAHLADPNTPIDLACRLKTKSGQYRWYHARGEALRDAEGRPVRMAGSLTDITERKLTEEALLVSEERSRTVLASLAEGVIFLDHNGVIMTANDSAVRILGIPEAVLLGTSIYDAGWTMVALDGTPLRMDAHPAVIALQTNQPRRQMTLGIRRGDGSLAWVSVNATPLFHENQASAFGVVISLHDLTEQIRQERTIRESRSRLRRLAAGLQTVREEERSRLSREVHDVLGQALTGLRMDVAMIEKKLLPEQRELHRRTATMKGAISDTIQVVRRIAADLRPGILDDLGVVAAIEWEAQKFEARTEIVCTFTDAADDLELDRERATTLFRIFQEVMTNVARHAGATAVDILLKDERTHLELVIHDNGRGIRPEEIEQSVSLGLLGIRERLYPWGGQVTFEGVPHQGTRVNVILPMQDPHPSEA